MPAEAVSTSAFRVLLPESFMLMFLPANLWLETMSLSPVALSAVSALADMYTTLLRFDLIVPLPALLYPMETFVPFISISSLSMSASQDSTYMESSNLLSNTTSMADETFTVLYPDT